MSVVQLKLSEGANVAQSHGGFVCMYRAIQQQEWWQDIPKRLVFEYCLLNAQHAPYESTFRCNTVTLEAGQLHTCYSQIAKQSGIWQLYDQFVGSKDVLGACKRAIKSALDSLVKNDVLSVKTIGKGKAATTVILVKNWSKFQSLPVTKVVTNTVTNTVTKETEEKQGLESDSVTNGVTNTVTNTVTLNNNVFNNNKNTYVKNANAFLTSMVQKLFNEILGEHGIAQVYKLTDQRKRLILKCAKEFNHTTEDDWVRLFEFITESDFLMGRNERGANHANWKLTFDWLFKPSNFVKVIEDQYHVAK